MATATRTRTNNPNGSPRPFAAGRRPDQGEAMIRCKRCGIDTPRLTVRQDHCPACAIAVAAIITADARRRTPRFPARDLTGLVVTR